MFYIFLLFLGLGFSRVLSASEDSDDSETNRDSQLSASTLNKRWLKSRSAGRDVSGLHTTYDSEEFEEPNIPSDFDAKYGLDKTRFKRTPYPILSRRETYEDYGKAPHQDDSIKTEEISFDFSSSKDKKVNSASPKMTFQSQNVEHSTTKNLPTLKTLENSPHPKLAPKNMINKLEPKQKPGKDSKSKKENKGIQPEQKLNHKPVSSDTNEQKQSKQADEDKMNKQNPPKSPLQPSKLETQKTLSTSQNNQELADNTATLPPPTSSPTKVQEQGTVQSFSATEGHVENRLTSLPVTDTAPVPRADAQTESETLPTVRQDITAQFSQRSTPIEPPAPKKAESDLPKVQSPPLDTPLPRGPQDTGPKLNRPKGRRSGSKLVLKPPPEDWPQPEAVRGGKQVPIAPEFTAIPPLGSYVDSGKRKSGYKADSFVSPPYMGHVKIDLVPAPEKPAPINKDTNETIGPAKWRIRGRRDRPVYSGYQRPGLSVSLTMKPSSSQYFFADNITNITPSVRSARPFRTYINFRQRGPMNVGRLFGPVPPPPPFPQPQPPPQHFHAPFNQAPFPQHPQFPHPPFPPFPRGPPPPRFGPPPHPRFSQPRPPPPPPFPPFPQGPPPPPPHFQRGPPPPHPQYPFPPPTPPLPGLTPAADLPPPPPSPYPTGVVFPTVRPFYENIPTISAIDNVPAPWPRRQVYTGTFEPKTFVPRNFSAYKRPRRGRAYEQYGKADLRPKKVRLYEDIAVRGTPKSPIVRGLGYGVEFQTDVTRGPYVPGPMFVRKTWPTRGNKFGYEPYRRSSDRRRPFGGFGRFAADKPPVLGDFGQFKPYRRLNFEGKSVYNFSRPTRSYTFPPRLQMAIKNATYQRRSFRRFDRERFDRQSLGYIPAGTFKSFGLADNIAHDHDRYGNLITRKGHIMNLQDLKRLFTAAPLAAAPVAEAMEAAELISPAPVVEGVEGEAAPALDVAEQASVAPVAETRMFTAPPVFESLDSEIVTTIPEAEANRLLEEFMRGKPQARPVGMTAKEALRAAAREAIRDTEREAYDRGETVGGGLARRKKGGFRPRGDRGRGRGRGRSNFGRFGTGARNFRRAKRSVDEADDDLERRTRVRRDLKLDGDGDYLTGPGAHSRSSSGWTGGGGGRSGGDPPLRVRRFHPRRGKGRPLKWGDRTDVRRLK